MRNVSKRLITFVHVPYSNINILMAGLSLKHSKLAQFITLKCYLFYCYFFCQCNAVNFTDVLWLCRFRCTCTSQASNVRVPVSHTLCRPVDVLTQRGDASTDHLLGHAQLDVEEERHDGRLPHLACRPADMAYMVYATLNATCTCTSIATACSVHVHVVLLSFAATHPG